MDLADHEEPYCCRGEKIPIPAWDSELIKRHTSYTVGLSKPAAQVRIDKMLKRLHYIEKTASLPPRFLQYLQEVSTQIFINGRSFVSNSVVTVINKDFFKLNGNIYILLQDNGRNGNRTAKVVLNITSGLVEIHTARAIATATEQNVITMSFESLLMEQVLKQTFYTSCYCNTCQPIIRIPQIPRPRPRPNQFHGDEEEEGIVGGVFNRELPMFVSNYNVLRIMSGMSSISYDDSRMNNERIVFNRSNQYKRQCAESRVRMNARTQLFKEELISNVFHPRRIDALLESGIMIEDL
jgi:hypothetical protein